MMVVFSLNRSLNAVVPCSPWLLPKLLLLIFGKIWLDCTMAPTWVYSKPFLKSIYNFFSMQSECAKFALYWFMYSAPKTLLFFVIRDHIGTTPLSNLEAVLKESLGRIWSEISKVSIHCILPISLYKSLSCYLSVPLFEVQSII
jgi:hypothetical protein